MKELDISKVVQAWESIVSVLDPQLLRRIKTAEELDRVVNVLDELLMVTAGDRHHVAQSLIELLGDLVEEYEARTLSEPNASPAEVLELLMEASDLKQVDLAQELGGQSVVSEILRGKRSINAKQAAALAARFSVSPALFIAKLAPAQPNKAATASKVRPAKQLKMRFKGSPLLTRGTMDLQGLIRGVIDVRRGGGARHSTSILISSEIFQ
jgi:HTH-type transcriptional regulator/antitoxin HigA